MNTRRTKQKDRDNINFIIDAAGNGDPLAKKILQGLQKLDLEMEQVMREIKFLTRQRRSTVDELQEYYHKLKSALTRLKAIPKLQRQMIEGEYQLQKKKPLIYLQTIKRKRNEKI